MRYDPIRAILTASSEELARLLDWVGPVAADEAGDTTVVASISGAPRAAELPEAEQEEWREAGVLVDDTLHPTVAGMLGVLSRPGRSVVIERFCQNLVVPLFVAWGPGGRATLTDGIPGGDLMVQATSIDLLAPILMQTLHLHRGIPEPDDRRPLTTTAGALESLLAGGSGGEEVSGESVSGDPGPLLADLRFAWRASGSRPGAEIDTAVTVLSTGRRGLWTVAHDAQAGTQPASTATEVGIEPTSLQAVTARLGDVITGRKAVAARQAVG